MTTPVTTLEYIEAYAPEQSVAIEDVAETLRLNRHQVRLFRRIHGLDRFRRDPGSASSTWCAFPPSPCSPGCPTRA